MFFLADPSSTNPTGRAPKDYRRTITRTRPDVFLMVRSSEPADEQQRYQFPISQRTSGRPERLAGKTTEYGGWPVDSNLDSHCSSFYYLTYYQTSPSKLGALRMVDTPPLPVSFLPLHIYICAISRQFELSPFPFIVRPSLLLLAGSVYLCIYLIFHLTVNSTI